MKSRRWMAVVAAAMTPALVAVAPHRASAATETTTDAITDSRDAAGGLDLKQITRGGDASTVTFTVQLYDPVSVSKNETGALFVRIDTTGAGVANYRVIVGVRPGSALSSPTFDAVIGPMTPHGPSVQASLVDPTTISIEFPRSDIGGATTFGWNVSTALAFTDPSTGHTTSQVQDRAPDVFDVGLPEPIRVSGADRISTTIEASFFPSGTAAGVVLARSDDYPDALGGAALAGALPGPLLLTGGASLDARVLTEIRRVLPPGGPVVLLGGPAAISTGIAAAVTAAGYQPVRFQGSDRYQTALSIVQNGLGDPTTILLTTGTDFPDALSAGAPAVHLGAGILLTSGATLPAAVAGYLSSHPNDKVFAIGGPAAAADPNATPIVGTDRYDTALKVAQTLFDPGDTGYHIGIASGTTFADALAASATMGLYGGRLLLTDPRALSAPIAQYLHDQQNNISRPSFLFGGPAAVTDNTAAAIAAAVTPRP